MQEGLRIKIDDVFFRFLTVIGGNNIYLSLMITNKDCSKEKTYDESFWKILEDEVIVLCLLFNNVSTYLYMLFNYVPPAQRT